MKQLSGRIASLSHTVPDIVGGKDRDVETLMNSRSDNIQGVEMPDAGRLATTVLVKIGA